MAGFSVIGGKPEESLDLLGAIQSPLTSDSVNLSLCSNKRSGIALICRLSFELQEMDGLE